MLRKKLMKRISAAALVGVMSFSTLAACGSSSAESVGTIASYNKEPITDSETGSTDNEKEDSQSSVKEETSSSSGYDPGKIIADKECYLGDDHIHYSDIKGSPLEDRIEADYEILHFTPSSQLESITLGNRIMHWSDFELASKTPEDAAEFLAGFDGFTYSDEEYTKENILNELSKGWIGGRSSAEVRCGEYKLTLHWDYDYQAVENDKISFDNWDPKKVTFELIPSFSQAIRYEDIRSDTPYAMIELTDGTRIHAAEYVDYDGNGTILLESKEIMLLMGNE